MKEFEFQKKQGDNDGKFLKRIKEYLENNGNINTVSKEYNFEGWGLLHYACYYNDLEAVKFLVENGIDIIKVDNHITAYRVAMGHRHNDIIEYLRGIEGYHFFNNEKESIIKNNKMLKYYDKLKEIYPDLPSIKDKYKYKLEELNNYIDETISNSYGNEISFIKYFIDAMDCNNQEKRILIFDLFLDIVKDTEFNIKDSLKDVFQMINLLDRTFESSKKILSILKSLSKDKDEILSFIHYNDGIQVIINFLILFENNEEKLNHELIDYLAGIGFFDNEDVYIQIIRTNNVRLLSNIDIETCFKFTNKRFYNTTCLHVVAETGSPDILKYYLYDAGIPNLTLKDGNGQTVVDYLTKNNIYKLLETINEYKYFKSKEFLTSLEGLRDKILNIDKIIGIENLSTHIKKKMEHILFIA